MKASTRRLALQAAAKAALSVTFLGCGGVTLTEATADAGTDSVTRVEPDAAQCPGDVYWKRFDCCVQSVNELLEEDSGSAPDAAPAPGYLACCQTIVAVANDPMEADAASVFNGRAVFTCCDVLGASGISTRLPDGSFGACDPWGPPVPPEMPGHLMDWQEVA